MCFTRLGRTGTRARLRRRDSAALMSMSCFLRASSDLQMGGLMIWGGDGRLVPMVKAKRMML